EQLRAVLAGDVALYGEWLFLTHTVAYDRLPSYLVALDLWRTDIGFLSVEHRDTVCAESGLTTPPRLWQGIARDIGAVERLLGPSAWGPARMEGLVVRSLERPDLRAKLLTTAFVRIDDDDWRGGRPRNRLADEAASWR
ncbi:MAG: RNA ligase family protein, partial [Acidimicrobiales bacterium]